MVLGDDPDDVTIAPDGRTRHALPRGCVQIGVALWRRNRYLQRAGSPVRQGGAGSDRLEHIPVPGFLVTIGTHLKPREADANAIEDNGGVRNRGIPGRLVATGLPIPPFDFGGVRYWFGQANNAMLYPGLGLGLGVIVSGASKITDGMLLAAASAVAGHVDVSAAGAALLPAVENLRVSSASTAVAVAQAAVADGVATVMHDILVQAVQDAMWQPFYQDGSA